MCNLLARDGAIDAAFTIPDELNNEWHRRHPRVRQNRINALRQQALAAEQARLNQIAREEARAAQELRAQKHGEWLATLSHWDRTRRVARGGVKKPPEYQVPLTPWERGEIAKQDAVAIVAASFIPGIGEALDAAVLASPNSSFLDRVAAGASLGVNYLTGGLAPNYGALVRHAGDFPKPRKVNPVAPKFAGSGPVSGVLEVSDLAKSSKAFQNYKPSKSIEYVFDPTTNRFAVGKPKAGGLGSPHEQLSNTIDGNRSELVGGMFRRGKNGEIVTDEYSGHFGLNWTPEVREQFVDFLQRMTGQKVEHSPF